MPEPLVFNHQTENQTESTSTDTETEGTEVSDFGNQFLNEVDEADREVVSKYIKKWDGGVTKKFQSYSNELKDYKELGDISALTNASQIWNDLRSDPVGFFEYMRDYLTENQEQISSLYGVENLAERLGIQMTDTTDTSGGTNGLPEYEGLPESAISLITGMQEKIDSLVNKMEANDAATQEQNQMAMLDKIVADMHTEHGDFDDSYVLTQIANGKTPEQALKAFNDLKTSILNSQGKPAPDLLMGPSGTPLDQVDVSKLNSPEERKAFGAALLQRNNQT